MSPKDYTKFADAYNRVLPYVKDNPQGKDIFDSMVNVTANVFAEDNGRFDRDRFMDAVYKEQV